MIKIFTFTLIFISSIICGEKKQILDVLDRYNKAFGEANYSQIIKFFDYPTYFNLSDKTISATNRFKLKLIYKKLRGDLPDYYSYSKWGNIDIQLLDSNIAIVNADFSRYKDDNSVFFIGSAQYHLRLENNEWKIFSLTPYSSIKSLN